MDLHICSSFPPSLMPIITRYTVRSSRKTSRAHSCSTFLRITTGKSVLRLTIFLTVHFSEPVSDALHTIPKYAFKDYPFPCAKDFPTQEASAVDPEVRQPAKGDRMTAIMDSCVKARAKRRAGREEDRMKTMSEVDSRPSLSNRNRLIRCVC